MSGCKCKSGCVNRRCKCVKSSTRCGPGCRCTSCQNLHQESTDHDCEDPPQTQPMHDPPLTPSPHVSDQESTSDSDSETEEIMDEVFGN